MSVIHQMLRDLEAGRARAASGAPTSPAQGAAPPGAGDGLARRLPRLAVATSLLVLVAAGLLRGPAPAPGAADGAAVAAPSSVATPSPAAAEVVPSAAVAAAPAGSAPLGANVRKAGVTAPSPERPRTDPVALAPRSLAAPEAPGRRVMAPPPQEPAAAPSSGNAAPELARPEPVRQAARQVHPDPAAQAAPAHAPKAPERAERAEPAPGPAPAAAARIERRQSGQSPTEGADALYRKGLAAYNAGRLDEAVSALRSTLAEQAGHAAARQALVAILVDRGELAAAQSVLAEALSANPRQAQFAMLSSQILVRLGDPAAATRTLAAAAHEQAPAELHAALAGLMAQARRDREALPHWLAALRRAPDRGAWWLGLALSLEADGRGADAAEAYQRALAAGGLNADVADFARGRVAGLR